MSEHDERHRRALTALQAVCDPELPVLTIADLGILRDVRIDGGMVEVDVTPTYSGCPAMSMIALDVEVALARAGFASTRVNLILTPAWTSDWLSEEGRRKLEEHGIAAPQSRSGRRLLFCDETVSCPRCKSKSTEKLSDFGSTSCKALWRCLSCQEPFDYFKCH